MEIASTEDPTNLKWELKDQLGLDKMSFLPKILHIYGQGVTMIIYLPPLSILGHISVDYLNAIIYESKRHFLWVETTLKMLLDQQNNKDKEVVSTGGKTERIALSRITVKQEMAKIEEASKSEEASKTEEASKSDKPAPAATTPPAPTTPASTAAPAKEPASGSLLQTHEVQARASAAERKAATTAPPPV